MAEKLFSPGSWMEVPAAFASQLESPTETLFLNPDTENDYAPVDELTGLPLPIAPIRNLPENTRHHAFWLPPLENSYFTATLGGRAIKHCRIQMVNAKLHNDRDFGVHANYIGTPVPETEPMQFKTGLFGRAVYIPEVGLHFTEDGYVEAPLEAWQLNRLRRPRGTGAYRDIRFGSQDVQAFFAEYVTSFNFAHLNRKLLSDMLSKNDAQSVNKITQEGIDMATQEINPTYAELYAAGLLHPEAPASASQFVDIVLGSPDKSDNRYTRLAPLIRQSVMKTLQIIPVAS